MGKRIGIITVALALIAGLAQGAVPVAAGSTKIPALGRVNTFIADETASTLVRIPASIPVSPEMGMKARFEGNGRIIAFVLVKEDWAGRANRRPMIAGERLGECYDVGCAPQTLIGGSVWGRGVKHGDAWEVPAGLYRLYVVTDGAPAEMKLIVPGFEGRASFAPAEPATSKITTLTPQLHEMVGFNVYAAGETSPFPGKGYSFIGTWRKGEVKAGGAYGVCAYGDEPPAIDAPVSYLPVVCPESYRDANVYAVPIRDYSGSIHATFDYVPAALGMWWASGGVVRDYGATVLWLDM